MQIQFGFIRVYVIGNAGIRTPRFCLFTFKGSKAPLKMKMAAGNIVGPFAKQFEVGVHGCPGVASLPWA